MWRRRTFTKRCAATIPAGAMRLSMFTIRNSHRARKRGWITTSTSVAELSISTGGNTPREIRFRWRTDADDERDAEAAEAERLLDEGKNGVSIGWGDPTDGDKTIEHEVGREASSKDDLRKETTRNRRARVVHYAGPSYTSGQRG
jgi:hypothetical protein